MADSWLGSNNLLSFPCLKVFCDIRDRHFSNVFGYLSQKAKDVQSGYDVSMWWVNNNVNFEA